MQKLFKHIVFTVSFITLAVGQIISQGISPVGVDLVIVKFDQAPTEYTVTKAPLKYNKDFALSMQVDDADLTLFTHGFPVFEGGTVNGNNYNGLFYSDGCGNAHSFKMSSSVYVFNEENKPDIHVDNSHGQLSWEQMDTIYNHQWGILNHGVNGDASSNPLFIDYSINRNKSYIRRQLYNANEGGVIPHIFVNPNGNTAWTIPSFELGNISALNQSQTFPIGENGGNVNNPDINWTQPYSLYRKQAESINVSDYVSALADSSANNANYWGSIFTHSLTNDYIFNDFTSDFNYIASTYGINGFDNILMTTDEEIQDYLIVRDATTIDYVLSGTSLIITFDGEIPDDLLYYSSSLVVNSNATITDIVVYGSDDYTYTGVGNLDALINLNWDGHYIIPPENYADSMVTIAVTSQTQYDSWIAMDYVATLTNGTHKDSLRNKLCEISGMTYDDGFCNCEIALPFNDATVNFGDCIDLLGADGEYTYEWYVADTLIGTTQNINVCPGDTTQYNHIATNTLGCPAEDSITVNVIFFTFDLGPDTTICDNSCITLDGPPNMTEYNWIVAGATISTSQSITPCPTSQTEYKLIATNQAGITASDSIVISLKPSPIVFFAKDSLFVNLGDNILLTANYNNVGDDYSFSWLYNGHEEITLRNNYYNLINPTVSDYVHVSLQSDNMCIATDSAFLQVSEYPPIFVSNDTSICSNQPLELKVTGGSKFLWIVDNDTISTDSILLVSPLVSTNYIAQTAYDNSTNYSADTVVVTIYNSTDTKIISSTNTVCTYAEVSLEATGADHYLWMPSEDTNQIYTFNIADTTKVYLFGSSDNGCQSVDSITINTKPPPQVSFTGLLSVFCENDPYVTLTGLPTGGVFSGEGVVEERFYPENSTPGVHEIVYSYINSENCMGYDTNITTIYANGGYINIGNDFSIQYDSSKLLDAGSGFDSYFWTTGATTQTITVFGNEKPQGTYEYAVMGVVNGCSTKGSVNITFVNTSGLITNNISNLTIIPNPNSGKFSVKFSTPEKNVQLSIYNHQGKTLFKEDIICVDKYENTIDINEAKPGLYFIKVDTKSGSRVEKIIIK